MNHLPLTQLTGEAVCPIVPLACRYLGAKGLPLVLEEA